MYPQYRIPSKLQQIDANPLLSLSHISLHSPPPQAPRARRGTHAGKKRARLRYIYITGTPTGVILILMRYYTTSENYVKI